MNSIITDFSQQFGITPNKIFKAEGDVTAFPQASGVKVQDADTANAEYLKKLETAKDSLGSFDSSSKPLKKVKDFFGERTVWTNDKDLNTQYSKIINATHKNLLSAGKESILFKDSAEEPGKKEEAWSAVHLVLAAKDNDPHNPSSNIKLLQDKARSIISNAMALKASDIAEPIKTPERVLVAQILGGTDAQRGEAAVQLANRLNADDLGSPAVNLNRETNEVTFNSGFFSRLAETLDNEHGGQIAATRVFQAINALATKTMTKEDYKTFKLDEAQIKNYKQRLWFKFESGALKDIKTELNETVSSATDEDRNLWIKIRDRVTTVMDNFKAIVTAPFRGGEDARTNAMKSIMAASAEDSIHALSLEVAKGNLERVKADLDSNRDLVTLSLGRETLITDNSDLKSESTEIGSALLANHIINTLKLAETLKSPDPTKVNISDADVKTTLDSLDSSNEFTVKANNADGKLQSYQVGLNGEQLTALKNAVKNGIFVLADVKASETNPDPDIGLKQNGEFVEGKTIKLSTVFNALKDQMKEDTALLDDTERKNITSFVQVLKEKNILAEDDLKDENNLLLKDGVTSDALIGKVTIALQNTNFNDLLNNLAIRNLNVVLNAKDANQKKIRDKLGAFIEKQQSHVDDQLASVREIDVNSSKSLADTANQSNISMPHDAAAEVLMSLLTAKGEWKTTKLLEIMDKFEPIRQLKQSIEDKYTQLNQQATVLENSQLLAVLKETQANVTPSSGDGLKIKAKGDIEALLNDAYRSTGALVGGAESGLTKLRNEVKALVKEDPSLQADILKSMDDSKFSDDKNSTVVNQRNKIELFLNLGEFIHLADERRTQLANKANPTPDEKKSLGYLNNFLNKFKEGNELKLADKEKYTEEMSNLQMGLKSVDDQLDEIKQSVGKNFNVSSRSVKDLLSPKSGGLTESDRMSVMQAVSSTIARTAMVLGIGTRFEAMTKERVNGSKLNSNPLMSDIMNTVSDHILQAA
jgi:hypothetical protein